MLLENRQKQGQVIVRVDYLFRSSSRVHKTSTYLDVRLHRHPRRRTIIERRARVPLCRVLKHLKLNLSDWKENGDQLHGKCRLHMYIRRRQKHGVSLRCKIGEHAGIVNPDLPMQAAETVADSRARSWRPSRNPMIELTAPRTRYSARSLATHARVPARKSRSRFGN